MRRINVVYVLKNLKTNINRNNGTVVIFFLSSLFGIFLLNFLHYFHCTVARLDAAPNLRFPSFLIIFPSGTDF